LLDIDPDIRRARTPPAELYRDPDMFRAQKDRVLRRAWHLAPTPEGPADPGQVHPFVLLPGVLDAPLVLVRDEDGRRRCLSNVCTHRANLVVERPGSMRSLRCRYHGRRFGLDGRFVSMPEFGDADGFPTADDDLPQASLASLGPLGFVSLVPFAPFEEVVEPLVRLLSFAPLSRLEPGPVRDYEVAAHWALYVENYLEGFHIPYVHAALNQTLDYGAYRTELFSWSSLQIGVARETEACFELPPGHPDERQRIAAYYFFAFPSTMINVYPWGVSVNAVMPVGIDRTRIRFASWLWDVTKRDVGAGADLDRVEIEDEQVVESVQRGVISPLFRRGRYSPARERGVHHFHRLLAGALAEKV
jgi:choline monooxygenase